MMQVIFLRITKNTNVVDFSCRHKEYVKFPKCEIRDNLARDRNLSLYDPKLRELAEMATFASTVAEDDKPKEN